MPEKAEETVKVVVRVRPLSRKEIQDGHDAATVADEATGRITCNNPKADASDPPKAFTFDAVFDPNITQRKLYDICSAPVVDAVLAGFNGTIFACGQTGAGKTLTMEGVPDPPELRGIIPNAFQQIFDRVALAQEGQQFLVRASYLEIYNEEIRDLLSKDPKNKLELKENVDSGVYVKDLTSFIVKSSHEIDQVMQAGKKNRSVAAKSTGRAGTPRPNFKILELGPSRATLMNAGSSRSHAIFTIIVERAETDEVRGEHITVGKLNLVDLAGSERQGKTGATGDRLKEATKINLSLSALGNVISALVDGKSQHIPYRDSKLTRLLQDSLGGNTKTVMCANCGPLGYNYDETVSTLRYANRAKNIKNKPKINEDPKDAMLREFTDEIARLQGRTWARLKAQLAGGGSGGGAGGGYGPGVSREVVEVEKIVEKEVVKEAETEEEREKLRADLVRQELERKRASEKKRSLAAKLKGMEAKLLKGGQMLDKAATQEAELRKAERELVDKEEAERALAQELGKRDEVREDLSEKYSSIEEEVDKKTRKLEKLVRKVNEAEAEIADLQGEFQREREDLCEDMLDTIRQLARQIKLKEMVLELFVPPDRCKALEDRTVWQDDKDAWSLEGSGRDARAAKRPTSAPGLRRPETEYARHRKQYDPNPRYKYDDIAVLELDAPERTTQDYEGPTMRSNIEVILETPIDMADVEVVPSGDGPQPGDLAPAAAPEPAHPADDRRAVVGAAKTTATRAGSARPKTASRRRPKQGAEP
ncbi:microtubule motor protein [Aureococcus anophagefferens]|uniref:Kinesin-like protein n=1 Tax=Aureococcus anophagefferens TaxID=44056 RepID=A0ABR1FQU7_AURAN